MRNKLVKQALFSVLILLAIIGLSSPKVSALTLADLLAPGASITVGDKIFYNFEAQSFSSGVGATPVALTDIIVAPTEGLGSNGHYEYGLRFVITANGSVSGGQGKDILIEFNVTTTYHDNRIIDDYLSFSGGASGGGEINISETVTDEYGYNIPAVGEGYASLYVFQTSSLLKAEDSALFDPQNILHINKDVNWFATTTCPPNSNPEVCVDRAFISHFEQLFSQTSVPEPSSMLLLGTGLVGLMGWSRRRFSK